MKTIKTLGIFLLTFLIGYLSAPNIKNVSEPVKNVSDSIESKADNTKEITQLHIANKSILSDKNDSDSELNQIEPFIKHKIKLLETGEFHTENLTGKTGETWLGLFKIGDKYQLKSTKILIKKILNPDLYDKEVFTTQKGEVVFMLKGADFLKPSIVETVYLADPEGENKVERAFQFNGETYTLSVENNDNEDFLTKGSKLVLTKNGQRQVLRYLKDRCSDCFWYVNWVGDLDNDGKLDFYLDLSDHYNRSDKRLFLSSKAEKDKLVKEIASLVTVGC